MDMVIRMEASAVKKNADTLNDGETVMGMGSWCWVFGYLRRVSENMRGKQCNIRLAMNQINSGSVMPLCGIVLSLSRSPRDRANMLHSCFANICSHEMHVNISANDNFIKTNWSGSIHLRPAIFLPTRRSNIYQYDKCVVMRNTHLSTLWAPITHLLSIIISLECY